jgi:L-threonylcarbamoyladenylate synthase
MASAPSDSTVPRTERTSAVVFSGGVPLHERRCGRAMKVIDLTAKSDETQKEMLAPVARSVKAGDLVIVPTTTFYALAADALNARALRRVHAAKKRHPSKPFIVLVDSLEMIKPLARIIPEELKEIDWRFGRKGVTYVVPAAPGLPSELTGGTGTVAVRIERNEIIQDLLALVGQPVTGPSANVQGGPPPSTMDEAVAAVGDSAAVAVRWWRSTAAAPTTIVDLSREEPALIREGTVPWAEIAAVLGREPSPDSVAR